MVLLFDPESKDMTEKIIRFFLYSSKNGNKPKRDRMLNILRTHFGDKTSPFVVQQKLVFGEKWQVPKFELVHNCSEKSLHGSNATFFPAAYSLKDDKITVCTNFIKSEMDLKEQVEREVLFANYFKNSTGENETDRLFNSYLKACSESMKPYFSEKQLLAKSSQICAEYVIKYRDWNTEKLPHDLWSRFVNKKTEESAKNIFKT